MLAPERKAGTQFAQLHASGHIMFKSELRNKEKGRKTRPNKQSSVPHSTQRCTHNVEKEPDLFN